VVTIERQKQRRQPKSINDHENENVRNRNKRAGTRNACGERVTGQRRRAATAPYKGTCAERVNGTIANGNGNERVTTVQTYNNAVTIRGKIQNATT